MLLTAASKPAVVSVGAPPKMSGGNGLLPAKMVDTAVGPAGGGVGLGLVGTAVALIAFTVEPAPA
ncbi:MAG TPA: hypothetical protein VG326_05960 [Tepidisphaeraceae bacterium]|jgi:hypothetical protein|nr:hypothetical protein [Tepidisphaeraceae bacterium]